MLANLGLVATRAIVLSSLSAQGASPAGVMDFKKQKAVVTTLRSATGAHQRPDALNNRGFVLIGDDGYSATNYMHFAQAIVGTNESIPESSSAVVIIAPGRSNVADKVLYGEAIQAMAHYDPEYWALLGHGRGGLLASALAQTLHPRVKMLGLLGATPEPGIDLSRKNMYTLVVAGEDDQEYPPSAVMGGEALQQLPSNVVQLTLPTWSHVDFAGAFALDGNRSAEADKLVQKVKTGINLMQYPPVEEEGKQFLESRDGVKVERDPAGRWLIFSPESPRDVRAGVAFFQGAAVAVESYGALLSQLASRGYLVAGLIAPGRNAGNIPELATAAIQELSANTSHWFVSGHSLGANTAGTWAFENRDLPELRGLLLVSGTVSGHNFTEAGSTLPVHTIYGSRDGVSGGPDPDDFYITSGLDPWVSESYRSAYRVEGGGHYGFAYYGYQESFDTTRICKQDQIRQAVQSADDFMTRVLAGQSDGPSPLLPSNGPSPLQQLEQVLS